MGEITKNRDANNPDQYYFFLDNNIHFLKKIDKLRNKLICLKKEKRQIDKLGLEFRQWVLFQTTVLPHVG